MSPTHSPKQTPWTPGPWEATLTIPAHDGMSACWQIDAEYDAVCTTQFCYAPGTEANAHLIAAAPELYEALKTARDELAQIAMHKTLTCPAAPHVLAGMADRSLAAIDAALSKARPSNRGEA